MPRRLSTARAFLSLFSEAGAGPSTSVLAYTTILDKLVPHAVMLSRLRFALKPFVKFPSKYGLHSFRSGGASAAAEADVPRDIIATHGRWQSVCANRYIKASDNSRFRVTQTMAIAAQKKQCD